MNDSAFSLSEQQVRFFETFGYLGFPGLMADRTDEIIEAFEAVWSERGGGHNGQPHAGEARSCIVPFIDQNQIDQTQDRSEDGNDIFCPTAQNAH